jgi:predicted carbohydrate-binding protein with CBM5 and CBM33 domain
MAITKIIADSITSGAVANTPAFEAYSSSNQSVSQSTQTKMQFDTERFDTNSAYDNSTNHRFTVPSGEAGKYYIYTRTRQASQSGSFYKLFQSNISIYKNGSDYKSQQNYNNNSSQPINQTLGISATMDLSVGDYIEIYGRVESGDGANGTFNSNSYFGAYKILT